MSQGYELNLRDYWNIFLKRKWIILLSFFAVFVATVAYTQLQPALYRTSAIIKIEPFIGLSKVFPESVYWRPPSEIPDYERQITSLPIVEKAIRESGLISKDAPSEELHEFLNTTVGNISASRIEKTNMISITVASQHPKEATIIINKIIEVFRLENKQQKNQQARNVKEFTEQQMEIISDRLKESEDKLNELTQRGVGGLTASLTEKIADLESRRVDLLTKFTKLHPDIIKLDEQITSLKEQLQDLPVEEFEFGDLKAEVEFNKELYNFLRRELQEAKIKESEEVDNVIVVNPAQVPRRPFSPNKAKNYSIGIALGLIFGTFVGLISEHLDTSIGKIEDLESITKVSVIGVIPYFIEKEKDGREDLKTRKNILKIGKKTTKEDKIRKLRVQLITAHKETSIFLEAFRILGANVQVAFGEGGKIKKKCILITSSNPQEGKSIISANLSIIMAQMGYKTLLIDTDLRRSTVHKIFGLEKKDNGVTDILTGNIKLESAIRTVTDLLLGEMSSNDLLKNPWIDNLNLITSGTTLPDAPYLLNTEKMDELIKEVREKYDLVVMDSSPVLAVSDTSIIVPKIDGVIIVYRGGATSRLALRRAKMQIESVKGEGMLKGIVLNNVTPEVSIDNYYYYYRGRYYKYAKGYYREESGEETDEVL